MNKVLKDFLKGLSDQDAKELAEYCDGEPQLPIEMITVIIDNHPALHDEWNVTPSTAEKTKEMGYNEILWRFI